MSGAIFDVKSPLVDKLAACDRHIRAITREVWFTREFESSTDQTHGELTALTNMLSDYVKPSPERTDVIESIHRLNNLITSWVEGISEGSVQQSDLINWRKSWSAAYTVIEQSMQKIVQTGDKATLPVLEDEESTEAPGTTPVESTRKSSSNQRTLFTTESQMRQNPALKEFKLEGAEDAISEWRKTRALIPVAHSKGAPLFAVAKLPIIPTFARIADEATFRRLGVRCRSIGMYHILYDQIILGVNVHRVRDKSMSQTERDEKMQAQLDHLSAHYNTKMILATDQSANLIDNGYQFFWVIAEATLALMQAKSGNYPTWWSLS